MKFCFVNCLSNQLTNLNAFVKWYQVKFLFKFITFLTLTLALVQGSPCFFDIGRGLTIVTRIKTEHCMKFYKSNNDKYEELNQYRVKSVANIHVFSNIVYQGRFGIINHFIINL